MTDAYAVTQWVLIGVIIGLVGYTILMASAVGRAFDDGYELGKKHGAAAERMSHFRASVEAMCRIDRGDRA